jgi:hypothetical protein
MATLKWQDKMIALLEEIRDNGEVALGAVGRCSPRVLREQRPRIIKAKTACFQRGWTAKELDAVLVVMGGVEGPGWAAKLEHLAKGQRVTDTRRERLADLTNPAEMWRAEMSEPWEGES